MHKEENKNDLFFRRSQWGFTQKEVAKFIGLRTVNLLTHYEKGSALPSLKTALSLEILYRTPVAFLYPSLYASLRSDIRQRETGRFPQYQQELF